MKKILMSFILCALVFQSVFLTAGNKVKIVKQENRYKLLVNDKETFIYGAGCGLGTGREKEDYLLMAKEMGANCVRTWGIDQGTREYLDRARELGLWVSAGLWLNPVYENKKCSYITDTEYRTNVRKEVLDYIRQYKDHPAILFWNVGNEVFAFTRDVPEKEAFAVFLNGLIKDIKKIDQGHPVLYTSAGTAGLDYIIRSVPELDIFGMNLYGGISHSFYQCKKKNLNRPVLITEFGITFTWDCMKDINQLAVEPPDQAKAALFRNRYREIIRYKDDCIGVFAFHLGETTQDSLTWWNFNFKKYRLAGWYELRKLYTGQKNISLPVIKTLKVSKQKNLLPGEWIDASVELDNTNPDQFQYQYFCSTTRMNIYQYYVNTNIGINVKGSGKKVRIQVPEKAGLYRLHVLVHDQNTNGAVQNVSLKVKKK
ncbi:MAG: glycoside hydrolase family 2 TIM barrel-domain containing protein [bacterium]|nr:glycoside hydrolase family 2 TIM barrel-domain containing protein [bacterium]